MFKIESYITPILFSYVDKYIKNFRSEDSQVSLWGGDVSFNNLDLRLEVLEQELQLPFSFSSGHIHELLIHVPWTKLASEPITVTINTIECTLKLRNDEAAGSDASIGRTEANKEGKRRSKRNEVETPPGYIQSLVNKIVSNITIICNNLILKYVEEDIVLSVNVKTVSLKSADEKWEPAFSELSPPHLTLRKLLSFTDVTICLDKRNASGKIEVYQEPLLYRCSFQLRLLRCYHSMTAKHASVTRIDLHCESMGFCLTEQQIPMLIRLCLLVLALYYKELKTNEESSENEVSRSAGEEYESSSQDGEDASWAGWAWSWVPTLSPDNWDDEWGAEQQQAYSGHTLHFGFYVEKAVLTLKVTEDNHDRNYYGPKKLRFIPFTKIQFQGSFIECVVIGMQAVNVQLGVSYVMVEPVGRDCFCGAKDITDLADSSVKKPFYLLVGSKESHFIKNSLFDSNSLENIEQRRTYNLNWDHHMLTATEASMLERTPAVAVDYLYVLDLPEDIGSEHLSELGNDLEYSNLPEKASCRFVVGPAQANVCSGSIHRLKMVLYSASKYDYAPYSLPKSMPTLESLPSVTEEELEALGKNTPLRVYQITLFHPVINIYLADHNKYDPAVANSGKKKKKSNRSSYQVGPIDALPKICLECQCLDAKLVQPMYPCRLVKATCQLPSPLEDMFANCHSLLTVKIMGVSSNVFIGGHQTTVLMPGNISLYRKLLLFPQYWQSPDVPIIDYMVEFDSITITTTKAKLLVIYHVVKSVLEARPYVENVTDSSLLQDAAVGTDLPYLELCLEGLSWKYITTRLTVSQRTELKCVRAFVLKSKSGNAGLQQVLVLSGPETANNENAGERSTVNAEEENLFQGTVQYPISAANQCCESVVIFKLKEIHVCMDPILCEWMMYSRRNKRQRPHTFSRINVKVQMHSDSASTVRKYRKMSEVGSEPKQYTSQSAPQESIHSSEKDKDNFHVNESTNRAASNPSQEEARTAENMISWKERFFPWFPTWHSLVVFGEFEGCIVYFPTISLTSIDAGNIEETVKKSLAVSEDLEIIVLRLPSVDVKSAGLRYSLHQYSTSLPVKLQKGLWEYKKINFPWTIAVSNFEIQTLHGAFKLQLVKPVDFSCTVGVTTSYISEKEEILSAFGLCIHLDTKYIHVAISEAQVKVAVHVLTQLLDMWKSSVPKPDELLSEMPPPLSPTRVTPTGFPQPSICSVSEPTTPLVTAEPEEGEQGTTAQPSDKDIRVTTWLQWTLARSTFIIYSKKLGNKDDTPVVNRYIPKPDLKLVFDMEDITTSVDVQNVYIKVKSKVTSASIQHYRRFHQDSAWKPGLHYGMVMRFNDDASSDIHPVPSDSRHHSLHSWSPTSQPSNGFVSVTYTRALCKNVHQKWSQLMRKNLHEGQNQNQPVDVEEQARYISEVVLKIQPVDFLISAEPLKHFLHVFEPLLRLKLSPNLMGYGLQDSTEQTLRGINLNSNTLPLLYIETKDIRLFIPSIIINEQVDASPREEKGRSVVHDVCIIQVESIRLTPQVTNPLGRIFVRADIYQMAEQARILGVPGSEVEDRQYQLDVNKLSVNTSTLWELEHCFQEKNAATELKTMSENPALEWNNLASGNYSYSKEATLLPLITRFDLCISAAPAIVYQQKKGKSFRIILVCGHSAEVNAVSDIEVSISLSQLKLVTTIFSEFFSIFQDLTFSNSAVIKGRQEGKLADLIPDSGVDCDMSSVSSPKEVKLQPKHVQVTHSVVPTEILVTGGKIKLVLYDITSNSGVASMVEGFDSRRLHSRRRRTSKSAAQATLSQEDEKCSPREWETDEQESDGGYEASEEDSVDDGITSRREVRPLLTVVISQPHSFLSCLSLSQKIEASFFDVCVKMCSSGYIVKDPSSKCIPRMEDFDVPLLETRAGDPHPKTGIPPSLLTITLTDFFTKSSQLNVQFGRPMKVYFSIPRWECLLKICKRVSDCFSTELRKSSEEQFSLQPEAHVKQEGAVAVRLMQNFRKLMGNVSSISMGTQQVVLALETSSSKVLISTGGLAVNVNRIQKYTSWKHPSFLVDRICATVVVTSTLIKLIHLDKSKILLNPWSCSVEGSLLWEPWILENEFPQIQISTDSDPIVFEIGPDHVTCLHSTLSEMQSLFNTLWRSPEADEGSTAESISSPQLERSSTQLGEQTIPLSSPTSSQEQHYQDDLRAGAFQFVEAATRDDDLPLPYQVVFWENPPTMTWRYPQPRALTRVDIFPVPFITASDSTAVWNDQAREQVTCALQYWSDCRSQYQTYCRFKLSESQLCRLDLPQLTNVQHVAVATTWRVQLYHHSSEDNEENYFPKLTASARALAACMRVDSYFSPHLVPKVQLSVNISSLQFHFHNHISLVGKCLPKPLDLFVHDGCMPDMQPFMIVALDAVNVLSCLWDDSQLIDFHGTARCDVIDYSFLTQHCVIKAFETKAKLFFHKNITTEQPTYIKVSCLTDPVVVRFGPSVGHTLTVSTQIWNTVLAKILGHPVIEESSLMLITRYIICNDTVDVMKLGQVDTDESILLLSRQAHFYVWRTQKAKQLLHVGLESCGFAWGEPFSLENDGMKLYNLDYGCYKAALVIKITPLSATQKQVVISGQLAITNLLKEHFEILATVHSANKVDDAGDQKFIVPGNSTPASLIMNPGVIHGIRIKFFGVDGVWSGEIPLGENLKPNEAWLVKVPLKEKGHFVSIWCSAVRQRVEDGEKILILLCPLYKIRSHLPVDVLVHIKTPGLNSSYETVVKGQREEQQLCCPGAVDHTHHLTFQLGSEVPSTSPSVPLTYGMLDQTKVKKTEKAVDIDDILRLLQQKPSVSWPYAGEEFDDIEWTSAIQPQTDLQVTFSPVSPYCRTLLVEMKPWALIINMVGVELLLQHHEGVIYRIPHKGVLAPPKLEGTFHLGISIEDEAFYTSPLQLGSAEWTDSFYMPRISGVIPQTGFTRTTIVCAQQDLATLQVMLTLASCHQVLQRLSTPEDVTYHHENFNFFLCPVCYLTLTSHVEQGIRILTARPTYIVANHARSKLHVGGLCVISTEKKHVIKVIPNAKVTLSPKVKGPLGSSSIYERNTGVPLLLWEMVGDLERSAKENEFFPYISFSLSSGWSCPLKVSVTENSDRQERRNITVPLQTKKASAKVLISKEEMPVMNKTFAVTMHEKNGQMYLLVYEEPHPHVMIHNRCKFRIFCAQGTSEKDGIPMPETDHFFWQTSVEKMAVSHYSLSTLCDRFPNIYVKSSLPPLFLAIDNPSKKESMKGKKPDAYSEHAELEWSRGIDISMHCDQFISLPGHGDIKIRTEIIGHTIHIFADSVSCIEISAKEIRSRLYFGGQTTEIVPHQHSNPSANLPHPKLKSKAFSEVTLQEFPKIPEFVGDTKECPQESDSATSFHTATNSLSSVASCDSLPEISGTSNRELVPSELHTECIPRNKSASWHLTFFTRSLNLTLTDDFNPITERSETVLFCFDDICVSYEPKRASFLTNRHSSSTQQFSEMHICIGDIQIDNQMYERGSFDFPVVLMRQHPYQSKFESLITPEECLLETVKRDGVFVMTVVRETCENASAIRSIQASIQPVCLYIEDTFIMKMNSSIQSLAPTKLVFFPDFKEAKRLYIRSQSRRRNFNEHSVILVPANPGSVHMPEEIFWISQSISRPIRVEKLMIKPLSVIVSIHTSIRLYIALDHSPLLFSEFTRHRLFTTSYRLGHTLTMHYLSNALFHAGWVVGSLELLGSPGGFARTLGTGLWDFICMPYQGILQGPWGFLVGITHGSASLMKHITAGTLSSLTKLASSVARNLDRLSLDEEHVQRTEEARRQRPQGVTQGLMQGLTGLGISLLSAVGGIAHHPIQSVMNDGASTRGLVTSVGRGLVGVFTKPLSGAAELVALTGQGLLHGAGWSNMPKARKQPVDEHSMCGSNSKLKYMWKFLQENSSAGNTLLCVTEASCLSPSGNYQGVALLLTSEAVIIVSTEDDQQQHILSLSELEHLDRGSNPALLHLSYQQQNTLTEVDDLSHSRIVDFVRLSGVNFNEGEDQSEASSQSGNLAEPAKQDHHEMTLVFYTNPSERNLFISVFSLAKRQKHGKGFLVL